MIDMLHSHMTANDGYILDEIDELFKGKAVNGSGVCVDFDEINKAENMYKEEQMYKGYTDWDEFIFSVFLIFILLGIWGI